jgi:hypothetical protein
VVENDFPGKAGAPIFQQMTPLQGSQWFQGAPFYKFEFTGLIQT